jgi:DNA-binding MarR family transcriptional regulator
MNRYYEEELRAVDVTPAQFELLANIAGRRGAAQSVLAAALATDQTTLSRNLKILIDRGWVTKGTADKDARQVVYDLSTQGKETLERALPHWQRAQERMKGALGGEWDKVWWALDRLASSLEPPKT